MAGKRRRQDWAEGGGELQAVLVEPLAIPTGTSEAGMTLSSFTQLGCKGQAFIPHVRQSLHEGCRPSQDKVRQLSMDEAIPKGGCPLRAGRRSSPFLKGSLGGVPRILGTAVLFADGCLPRSRGGADRELYCSQHELHTCLSLLGPDMLWVMWSGPRWVLCTLSVSPQRDSELSNLQPYKGPASKPAQH